MSAYKVEELRKDCVRAEKVLRLVYAEIGPWEARRGKPTRLMPARIFGKMTKRQVEINYDFYNRDLAHKVAKVIARAG